MFGLNEGTMIPFISYAQRVHKVSSSPLASSCGRRTPRAAAPAGTGLPVAGAWRPSWRAARGHCPPSSGAPTWSRSGTWWRRTLAAESAPGDRCPGRNWPGREKDGGSSYRKTTQGAASWNSCLDCSNELPCEESGLHCNATSLQPHNCSCWSSSFYCTFDLI